MKWSSRDRCTILIVIQNYCCCKIITRRELFVTSIYSFATLFIYLIYFFPPSLLPSLSLSPSLPPCLPSHPPSLPPSLSSPLLTYVHVPPSLLSFLPLSLHPSPPPSFHLSLPLSVPRSLLLSFSSSLHPTLSPSLLSSLPPSLPPSLRPSSALEDWGAQPHATHWRPGDPLQPCRQVWSMGVVWGNGVW